MARKLARYAGMTGAGPALVTGQTGDYQRAVTFIQDAHAEIQALHFDWDFLWSALELEIIAGQALYPVPEDLGIWDAGRIFLNGKPLPVVEWHDYRPEIRDPAEPEMVVVRPTQQLQLVPTPDVTYTLHADYYRAPFVMVAGTDEPLIPRQFRQAIVGRALMMYGNYEAAPEAKEQGMEMYTIALEQLERHQLSRRQQTHGRQESQPIVVVAE